MRRPIPVRAAFSLVELLVVILIIGILIAIVLPALGSAKNAVRKAQSQTMIRDFLNAYTQFKTDNGRDPGRFSPRDLAQSENADAGFTMMENALMDLLGDGAVIGRVADVDADPTSYPSYDMGNEKIIKVGVSTSDPEKQYYVNTGVLGSEGYFPVGANFLVAQTNGNEGVKQASSKHPSAAGTGQFANTAGVGVAQMPDLVDAFGHPVLLWVADEYAPEIRATSDSDALDDFIQKTADADDLTKSSVFYPNANKGFLASKDLGKKHYDMTAAPVKGEPATSIGFEGGSNFGDEQRKTFMALFGNPAFPQAVQGNATLAAAIQAMEVVPAQARGNVIVHSAGIDGIYFSTREPGFRQKAITGSLEYWINFSVSGSQVETDGLAEQFDDVLQTSN